MNMTLTRRTRRTTAGALAALIALLSPGLGGYQALAIGLEGTVHPNAPVPAWRGGIGPSRAKKISGPTPSLKTVPTLPKAPSGARAKSSPEAARQALGRSAAELQKPLEEAVSGNDPRSTGENIQKIVQGESPSRSRGAAPAVKAAAGQSARAVRAKAGLKKSSGRIAARKAPAAAASAFIKERMADPRELYERAYKEALEAAVNGKLEHIMGQASRVGAPVAATKKELAAFKESVGGQLRFGEVTGSWPLREGRHVQFTFYVAGLPGAEAVSAVYVDFTRGYGTAPGQFESRASVASGVKIPAGLFPELSQPSHFRRGAVDSPESALDQAQVRLKDLSGRASFSLRWEKNPRTGDTDLWYRFYDEKGNAVAVNAAHTGEIRVLKRAAAGTDSGKPSSLWRRLAVGGAVIGSALATAAALFAAEPAAVLSAPSAAAPGALSPALQSVAAWASQNIAPQARLVAAAALGTAALVLVNARVRAELKKLTKDLSIPGWLDPDQKNLFIDLAGKAVNAAIVLYAANRAGLSWPAIKVLAGAGGPVAVLTTLFRNDSSLSNLIAGVQIVMRRRVQTNDIIRLTIDGKDVQGAVSSVDLSDITLRVGEGKAAEFHVISNSTFMGLKDVVIVKKWYERPSRERWTGKRLR